MTTGNQIPYQIYLLAVLLLISFSFPSYCNIQQNSFTADTVYINQLNKLSFTLRETDPDSAKTLALQAIKWSEKINYLYGLGDGYLRLGLIEKNAGHYTLAIKYYHQSLFYRKQLNNPDLVARVYSNIGSVYHNSGDYDSAVYYHLQSLKIAETIHDTIGYVKYSNNAGIALQKNKDYAEALVYYNESLKVASQVNDSVGIYRSVANLASVFIDLKENRKAINYLSLLFRGDPELVGQVALGNGNNNAGLAYQELNLPDSALFYFTRAEKIFREIESPELSVCLSNIGILLNEKGNHTEAIRRLQESNILAQRYDKKNILATNYYNLAEAFEKSNQLSSAFENLKLFVLYNDSVYNEEKTLIIEELKTKYETEKKDQENKFLADQNQLQRNTINKREAQLTGIFIVGLSLIVIVILLSNRRQLKRKLEYQQQLETDRMRISKDLHDDIGGALTSISMYSSVANEQIKNEHTEEAQTYLSEIADTSRELIGKMSDLVWAINPMNDSFENLIQRIRNDALRLLQAANIKFHFKSDELIRNFQLPMDERHHLYMILKESITNAAKYSGAENIYFNISYRQSEIVIEIKDDGIGFDTHEEFEGNGLKNMNHRAAQMHATLEIHSEAKKGSSVSIRFQLS